MDHDPPPRPFARQVHLGAQGLTELGLQCPHLGQHLACGLLLLAMEAEQAPHQFLRLPHVQTALQDRIEGSILGFSPLKPQQRPRVPLADPALQQGLLHAAGRFQQPERVGYRDTALTHPPRHLILCEPEFLGQLAVGHGLLQRVQIGPLEVLHQRQLQHLAGGHVLHDDGDLGQSGQSRSTPASLTCDQLISIERPVDDEWLNNPVFFDRGGQFHQILIPNGRSRLMRIWGNRSKGYLDHPLRCRSRFLGSSRDQCLQTSAQSTLACCHLSPQRSLIIGQRSVPAGGRRPSPTSNSRVSDA